MKRTLKNRWVHILVFVLWVIALFGFPVAFGGLIGLHMYVIVEWDNARHERREALKDKTRAQIDCARLIAQMKQMEKALLAAKAKIEMDHEFISTLGVDGLGETNE